MPKEESLSKVEPEGTDAADPLSGPNVLSYGAATGPGLPNVLSADAVIGPGLPNVLSSGAATGPGFPNELSVSAGKFVVDSGKNFIRYFISASDAA